MSKRQATSELNHDNWDQEDEKEEAGAFVPLEPSQLTGRVIKKAKRRIEKNDTSSRPFSSFAGFTSSTSKFNFFQQNTMNKSNFFADNNQQKAAQNNESSTTTQNNESTNIDSKKTNTNEKATPKENKAKYTRSIEYYRQLQSLNEGVLKWMQLHLSKNSCCDFTPVFNDYKKHLDTLNVTYPLEKKELSIIKANDSDISNLEKLKKEDNESSSKNDNKDLNTNNKSKRNGDETDYGVNFASNTTNTSTFSFGIKASSTATSSSLPSGPTTSPIDGNSNEGKNSINFSFGTKNDENKKDENNSSSFSFLQEKKSSENGLETTETAEYIPPKNDFTPVTEEDAFYTKRCKLFFKKDENYAEKGIGTLFLKPVNGKTQLLIRADTSLGNILLNILLSASLPMSRMGKNNVLIVAVPNPPLDPKKSDTKDAIPMLIRVKTSEDADELLEILNKHKS